jgi:glycosyltransferase involved in cell wall biosynthesis
MDLSIVVPCYNEEEVLNETAKRLVGLLDTLQNKAKISDKSKIYFVDDGSKDRTWELIESLSETYTSVHGLKLSRNRGHQNALLGGLFTAEGDALVSIDADLQDDIAVIEEMVDAYHAGHDIVYGVRKERTTDTTFKRATAEGFYKLMQLMGVDIVYNHADFRLMSRRAVEELKQYPEVNLFLRAMVPLIGYPATNVYYDRAERFAGESKYPLKKMLAFAWDGITSFSVVPLRLITATGFIIFVASVLISLWVVGVKLFTDDAVPGWASTVLPIYFIGGIQVFSIGIVGEYIGKMYLETKRRPRFIIEKKV